MPPLQGAGGLPCFRGDGVLHLLPPPSQERMLSRKAGEVSRDPLSAGFRVELETHVC